jgi:NRAMP (natural resistance-associated macrophage protein)-like metal ion transporter
MQRNVPATPPITARAQLARELLTRRVMHPSFDRTLDGLRKLGALRKGPRARPLAFLAFLGPGLIAANAGNDAGAVATWSSVGAQYGYAMLWVLVIITISLSVVQEMCARMGAATGKGLSDLIRERFGVRGAAFAMSTLLLANILITISEFAGIAAACELFGVPKYITVPLAAIGIWFVITRGSYDRVEKVFLVMSFAFFTYPIAAILAHPNWGEVARGFVVPTVQLNSTYLLLLIGTVGTTITPYMQLFIQSSVAEKGVTMEHYKAERNETYLGSIFAAFVVASIVIATGATIYQASGGQGVVITTAEQAAQALVPFLGKYAEALFGVGLLGASLLAAAVLPLATAYSVCETFGFERGVNFSFREAPIFQGLFTGMLALGALIALIPGLPLIQLIILAQVINGILLPILLIFILRLINDRRIMGQYTNTLAKNIIAGATVVILIGLTALMLASVILPFFGVPFLQ